MKIRIATRKSPLALAQTRWVAARIREHRPDVEVEELHVVTQGDRVLDKPLASIGGKGLFIKEVEQALCEGRAELAVHSIKDVPDELAEGMHIACIPERESPYDALVTRDGRGLDALAAGAAVGTSSLRRACQLRAARPDLRFGVLRGNVGTRLDKLDRGEHDAIVLACAGMARLGIVRASTPLPIAISIPAVGQGALGIEARQGDDRVAALLAPLEHSATRACVEAERAFLGRLKGSCTTPLAAHARFDASELAIDGMVGAIDGSRVLRAALRGPSSGPAALGVALAEALIAQGADALLEQAKSADPYQVGPYGPRSE